MAKKHRKHLTPAEINRRAAARAAIGLVKYYNAQVTKKAADAPPVVTTSPTVEPFLTGDDLMTKANTEQDFTSQLNAIDKALADLNADTIFQKTQVENQAKQGKSDTTDAMIARGLFQSSVKDAALNDIEAQRALQQKFLDDRLTRASLDADTQKKTLGQWHDSVTTALNQKAVENAAAVPVTTTTTPVQPKTFAVPTMKQLTTPKPAAAPAATGSAPQPTTTRAPAAAARAFHARQNNRGFGRPRTRTSL